MQPLSFTLSDSGMTHTGNIRTRNEDSFCCYPEQNLWVVADGMGGHDSGDYASQTIVEQAGKFTSQATLEDSIFLLEENFLYSHQIIKEKAKSHGKKSTIGSTVASLYIWQDFAFTLWAGDSRIYRYRDQKLERLTEDHSFVEELVRMGKISTQEAEAHPASNVVLNALGIDAKLIIDMEYYPLQDNDLFLICSDGLFKELTEADISKLLSKPNKSLEVTNDKLIAAALKAGGSDNCTVILVKAKLKETDG